MIEELIVLAQQAPPPVNEAAGGRIKLFVETLVRSLAMGSFYAILALGFVLIFKATRVINFAHGVIGMAGALFLSILLVDRGLPFLPFDNPFAPDDVPGLSSWILNLAIALVLVIILGLLLERFAIRPMVGRPVFSIVMITIGLEIIVRTFSVDASKLLARPVAPPWGVETFMLGDARVPWSFLIMYLTVAIAFVGAWLFFRTRAGVAMRAVSFDQEAAMAQGIDVGRVSALVWAAGAVLACLGAVFFAMFPFLPNAVSVEQHPIFVFRVLPVIVLGGLDSVPGALIGGLAIGAAEVFAGAYLAQHTGTLGAGYQQIIPYLIMLMVLLVRPYGLFGSPEVRRV